MVESTATKQLNASWTKVEVTDSAKTPIARSSHGVSVLGFGTASPKVVVYGGENEPRVPIDSTVHVLEFTSSAEAAPTGSWRAVEVKSDSSTPPTRVAHAQAVLND